MTRLIWRRWKGRHPTGIDRVCLEYLREFRSDAQAVIQHKRVRRILDRSISADLFALLLDPPATFRTSLVRNLLRTYFHRSLEGRERLYLNVGHTGLNDPGFRTWTRISHVRPIYLVHDLIPITHPEYCRAGEREKHIDRMQTVLRTGSGVIGNSEATLSDVSAFAQEVQLQVPPSLVALLGCGVLPGRDFGTEQEPPTFIVLGTLEARKNHLMLLQVWTRIVQRLGEAAPRLLIIGQRGWECEQALDLLDRSETLRGFVIEMGDCSDELLARCLSDARALLFPSLVEGYGLPLVEALRSGTPVIASDLPVFREIVGNVPDYLDPLDGPAWERAILGYASARSVAREAQLNRMAGYRPPSWDDHFATVRAWLSTI